MESIGVALYVPGAIANAEDLRAAGAREVREDARSLHVTLASGAAALNVMSGEAFDEHRRGLVGFVRQTCAVRDDTFLERVSRATHCLGVVAEESVDVDAELMPILEALAVAKGAFVFAGGRFVDAKGRLLAGPDEDDEPQEGEPEEPGAPPSIERIRKRALVLAAVARRGLVELEAAEPAPKMSIESFADELEPAERRLLEAAPGSLSPQRTVEAVWRQEGAAVLAWALGVLELPPADVPVEPAALTAALGDASGQLRAAAEIEALGDQLLLVHRRLVDERLRGVEVTSTPQIAVERRRAIEWLLGAHPTYSRVEL